MKTRDVVFKWLAIMLPLAVLMQFAIVLSSVSAQGEENITPTATPTESPTAPIATETPPGSIPTESETPSPGATAENEYAELAPPFVAEVEPVLQLFSQSQPSGSTADKLIAGGDSIQTSPALAYNSANQEYLIVWVDNETPASLRGRIVSETSYPITEEFIITPGIVSTPTRPEVVYNPADNSYLLVWSEPNGNTVGAPYYPEPAHNLYALMLANDGTPGPFSPVLLSNQMGFFYTYSDPTMAYALAYNSNANEFLVAWTQPPGAIIYGYRQAYRVMGQRLAPDGTLRAGQVTIKVGVFASIDLAYSPVSNEYLVTWDQYFGSTSWDLYAQRLRADTLAVSGSAIGLGTGQGRQGVAALAYSPGTNDYFVTWMASPANNSYLFDIVGRRVHAGTGALVGPLITILHDTDLVIYNDVAYSPVEDRFLVSGKFPTNQQLIGRYVTPLGEMPEDTFQITSLTLDNGGGTRADIPRIAARSGAADGASNWLTVWKSNDDIYARAIGAYECSEYESMLSPISRAVLDEVEPDQEFCGNHFESNDLVILPPGDVAFQKFATLASEARYEINFTTMIWEEGDDTGNAGKLILQGIKELYDKVQDPVANGLPFDHFSQGVRVRILVGLIAYEGGKDQRALIMRELDSLRVGPNDSKWNLEVAVYRNGFGATLNHSHVKSMVVDGKTVIVSGYNVQNDYLLNQRRDMGIQVSGPIALRALMTFDELWRGAWRCNQYDGYRCTNQIQIEDTSHEEAILTPVAAGDDVVFSLYRDDAEKMSDDAIVAAINVANSNVNIIQDRFLTGSLVLAPFAEAVLNVLNKDEPQVKVNLLVSGQNPQLYFNTTGICNLKRKIEYQDIYDFDARSSKFEVHTKALSIDNSFIIVGSQNFDGSAWGDFNGDLDLAEYNLAVDSRLGADTVNTVAPEFDSYFANEWDLANSNPIVCKSDNVSLQGEIDRAVPGSIIVIPAGIYFESVTINKPLTLVGANNQTVITPIGSEPAFLITSSDVSIMNMRISGGSGYGIELIDSSSGSLKNIKIYRVVFENNAQGGVLAQGLIPHSPMDYTIENNAFVGGLNGVVINMLETQSDRSVILNNIFYSQLEAPIAIRSIDDSHVEYSFNLFDNCGRGDCLAYWRDGVGNALSSQHDNLFDLDPLFSSPINGAFQLSADSPAIDSGDPSILHDLIFDGNSDQVVRVDIGAFEYEPVMNILPIVTAGNDQTVEHGNSVIVNATYYDEDTVEGHSGRIDWGDGTVEDVPTNATGVGSGDVASEHTFTRSGTYSITICVVDPLGGVGCDTLTTNVLHRFSGFFAPVDNRPTLNVVKAGSAIPIKFSLDGYHGLDILTIGYPTSAAVTCGSSVEDAIEQTVTAGESSLTYDGSLEQYIYVWKTDKDWAGTCRTFVMKLNDGSYHIADFKFK